MSRLLTPTDLVTLRRKPRALALLHDEALLVQRHRPLLFSVRSLLTNSGRYTTFVHHEQGVTAVLQAVRRESRPEQTVVALASYGALHQLPTDHDLWFRLLEAHVTHSARHQIQRLYATQSDGTDDLGEIFRQGGFTPYVRQVVLRLDGPDWDQGTRIAPMQVQSRHDVWGVHQLYGHITPRPIQLAEARAARDWMLPLQAPWLGVKRRAWVAYDHAHVVASLRVSSGNDAHLMQLLINPAARDQATEVLRFGISQIADTLPIWLVVRDYQEELLWAAQDLGFQPMAEQVRWVRHNVSFIRRPVMTRVLEPNDTGTPVPTIVPASEQARLYARTKRNHK
ncbi:MAG: hypothetical protein ACKO83_13850 [Roseiflexaceae bacterium]